MSELINKLALQAFEPINAISSEGVADWYTFNHTWFQLYNKRFAELIVKECINEIDSVTTGDHGRDEWDDGYDAGLSQASETIKEHFGVE